MISHPALFWSYIAGVAVILGFPLVFDREFFHELIDGGWRLCFRFAAFVLFWPIGLPTMLAVICFWELAE